MNDVSKYRKILEPFKLKHLTLKNRMVKAPYSSTNSDKRGYVLDSAVFHYDAIARGGVGLFINESVAVDPMGVSGSPRMAIWDDSFIPGQKRLVEAVHKYGTPILMQIHHAGPAHSKGTYGGSTAIKVAHVTPKASTTLTKDQLPGPRPNSPEGLTKAEIEELIPKYVSAAERARAAGFDGVELHFAAGYLMNSFFSRAWNKRTDEYGGSLENRTRFAAGIVHAVRQKLGNDFIIGARINGAEYGTRNGDGLTCEETSQIARILEGAGVDLIHIMEFGYNEWEWIGFPEQSLYPEPPKNMDKDFADAVKRGESHVQSLESIRARVSIPVIVNGGLNFTSAEKTLRKGRADLVSFARALIADPESPNKLRAGAAAEIRSCTRCITCFDGFMRSQHERCRVNAAFAKEQEMQIIPAAKKKNVLVIGAGPSGLEAARVATLRGHKVVVYERQPFLGGLLPLAALIKDRHVDDIGSFLDYLKGQVDRLGIPVKLGQSVDAQLVRKLAPDAVIVAAGSRLKNLNIPGIESANVVTSAKLMAKVALPLRFMHPRLLEWATTKYLPIGKRVVILGGLMQGIELAEFLVRRGREVIVTETSTELGIGILDFHRQRVLDWLKQEGCTLLSGVKYLDISKQGLNLVTQEGEKRLISGDTIIGLPVREPDHSFRDELARVVKEIHVVGDCWQPGMIVDAVESGYRAACAL